MEKDSNGLRLFVSRLIFFSLAPAVLKLRCNVGERGASRTGLIVRTGEVVIGRAPASGTVFDEVDSLFLFNRLLTCIRDDDVRTPPVLIGETDVVTGEIMKSFANPQEDIITIVIV